MRRATLLKHVNVYVIVIMFCTLAIHVQAQDDPPPPYLYYYSGILDSFVIERADGSDSRILAQNVIPSNHNSIINVEWSPSGKWFTWRSGQYMGPAPTYHRGWIMSSDGSQRLDMLDHAPDKWVDVGMMEWSPTSEFLFVTENVSDADGENAVRRFLLINADAGVVVASYEIDLHDFYSDSPSPFAWLPDQQGVAIYDQGASYYDDEGFEIGRVIVLFTDGTARAHDIRAWPSIKLLPNGRLAYRSIDGRELYIQDLRTETVQTFELPDPPAVSDRRERSSIMWNAVQNFAAFFFRHAEGSDMWLIDLESGTVLFQKPTSRITVLNGDSLIAPCFVSWSPDGLRFVFRSEGSCWLYDLNSQELKRLDVVPEHETAYWAENGQQVVLESRQGTHVYDLVSQQSALLPRKTEYESLTFLSPNGRYMGLVESPAIVDIVGISIRRLSPHSALMYEPVYVEDYSWHHQSEWAIIASEYVSTFMVVGVTDRGYYRRELTVTNAGWVPEHVIPFFAEGHPESVLQQPSKTYSFGGSITGVAWSPESDRIAAYDPSGQITIVSSLGSAIHDRFGTRSDCGGQPVPCPLYWEGENIIVGNVARNVNQETYSDAGNTHRIDCSRGDCYKRFSDIKSSDGRWLARLSDGTPEIIDTRTGEIVATFDYTYDIQWVQDRFVMLVNETIVMFTPGTLETVTLEGTSQYLYLHAMSISSDGSFVAASSDYLPIHVWSIETGQLVTVLNWYGYAIAFSPDGRWLAAGAGDMVTLWETSEFTEGE